MALESFCGSELWDWNLSWYTDNPDLTPCFQDTLLVWIPCALLAVLSIFEFLYYRSVQTCRVPLTLLHLAKMVLLTALVIVSVVEMVEASSTPVDLYTPLIRLLAFVLSGFLLIYIRRRGAVTSPTLFFFWLLLVLADAVKFRSFMLHIFGIQYRRHVGNTEFILTAISFPLVFGQFFLNIFAERNIFGSKVDNLKPSPELTASFLSKLLFWWFNGMARLGFKRPLRLEDMWSLSDSNTTQGVIKKFDPNWEAEVQKRGNVRTAAVDENGKPIFESQVSLLIPLVKTFAGSIFSVAFLKFITALLAFVNPQILDALITFVSSNEPSWHGVLYAVLMLLSAMTESFLNNQYEYYVFTLAMRVRSSLISVIYRKALTLSSAGKSQFTTGEIVNLMSIDVQRVMDYVQMMNMLWAAPLQIGIAIYFLWQQLGVATVGGIVLMILLIPVNGVVTAFLRKYQISLMRDKDKRIKLMNEILAGIRVLKLYAWENSFIKRITEWRNEEIVSLRKQAYLFGAVVFTFSSAPFFIALASFGTYVLIDPNNVLDANKAFVSLTLFNILRMPMAFLPMLITFTATFFVSLSRLNKFLRSPDLDPGAIDRRPNPDNAIEIENATFSWEKDGTEVLRDINISVPKGSLVAIVGTVGTGKSSLVSALLGDLVKKCGRVNVSGSVAYVPQQAWIQNATIRENIVFGNRFDRSFYEKILDSCALRTDLEILQGGDMTEVGEKGINLSGGQKQRISMARATYSRSDIYYLDDPLSAVDSHVGKHIFDKVISRSGLLSKSTRILVTHRLSVLPDVDVIYVLKDGKISEVGSYAELVARRGAFSEFLLQFLQGAEHDESLGLEGDDLKVMEDIAAQAGAPPELIRHLSRVSGSESASEVDTSSLRRRRGASIRRESSVRKDSVVSSVKSAPAKKKGNARLTEDEVAAVGSVTWSVYLEYAKAMGLCATIFTMISFLLSVAFNMGTSLWLSAWSNDATDPALNTTSQRDYRLGIYALFGILETIFTLWGSISLNLDVLRGSKVLHENMLDRILHAPMSFFDTTPMGRILNRFSKDIDTADVTMRMNFRQLLSQFFRTFASLIMIAMETPVFLLLVIPLGIAYYFVQKYYIATSRQLKRIESVSRSPIYNHFSETVTGASSIRAYQADARFVKKSDALTDINNSSYHPSLAASRWLAVRLEFLGYCIVFIAAMLAVFTRETLSPGIAGLSISYAMTITMNLNMLVRASSDVETNFVSIERCIEYSKTPVEAAWEIPHNKPPQSWPDKGQIIFDKYSTRYRSDLPLVIQDVSCELRPGEKVGVVGRTGAGKSSLTLSLFRLVEAAAGCINVDDINIANLGLHDLRSKLTIIPQDPVLFSGTLRMNLDPFNSFADDLIWKALQHAHLKDFVSTLSEGLDYNITEGGDNLSVGQRQLVCLARALLRKSKILVLDEATAAVDMETDSLIQNTIRQEFNDCTILTIAHRLNTIMDYDRVMVLDKGRVMEYDTPQNLLNDPKSMFYSLAKDADLV